MENKERYNLECVPKQYEVFSWPRDLSSECPSLFGTSSIPLS